MKEKYMEHVEVTNTRPTGSAVYLLDGVEGLCAQILEDIDNKESVDEKKVAKNVARQWFKEDFPLLSVGEIVAEKENVVGETRWRVCVMHTASTSVRSRQWDIDNE